MMKIQLLFVFALCASQISFAQGPFEPIALCNDNAFIIYVNGVQNQGMLEMQDGSPWNTTLLNAQVTGAWTNGTPVRHIDVDSQNYSIHIDSNGTVGQGTATWKMPPGAEAPPVDPADPSAGSPKNDPIVLSCKLLPVPIPPTGFSAGN